MTSFSLPKPTGRKQAIGGHAEKWERHAQASVEEARAAGEPNLLADALSELATARIVRGHGLQRQLMEEALRLGAAHRGFYPEWAFGQQLHHAGQLEEAHALAGRSLERADEAGDGVGVPVGRMAS